MMGMMGMDDGDDGSQPLHCQIAACSLPFAADGGEYFHSIVQGECPAAEMVALHLTCSRLTRLDTEPGRCLTLWLPWKSADVRETVFPKPWFTKDPSRWLSQAQLVPDSHPRCRVRSRVVYFPLAALILLPFHQPPPQVVFLLGAG